MKVLLVNTFDNQGGAALATYRLHRGLRDNNINSTLLVKTKFTSDSSVVSPEGFLPKAISNLESLLASIHSHCYPNHDNASRINNWLYFNLRYYIDKIKPDLIHLFWVNNGFIAPEELKNLNIPIVWTLHDMWPFTGGCHYDEECGKYKKTCGGCPQIKSRDKNDVSHLLHKRKLNSWKSVNMSIVATSKWIGSCASTSSLFARYPLYLIPNGIEHTRYKPLNQESAREAFSLPLDKKLILFSAHNATKNPRKGFQYLLPALNQIYENKLTDDFELVILGTTTVDKEVSARFPIRCIGNLHDEISQVMLYSAADCLVSPSTQENLSNIVVEAQLCGKPVIAFRIGGMPDIIDHAINGYLALPFDVDELSNGIVWALQTLNKDPSLVNTIRQKAVDSYSLPVVVKQYETLYKRVLK